MRPIKYFVTIDGRPVDLRTASQLTGIKQITIYKRLRLLHPGEPLETILLPIGHPRWDNPNYPKYTWDGVSLTSRQWAERLGINVRTMRTRISVRGICSETFTSGKIRRSGKLYTCNGESLTISQWVAKLGISKQRIHQRLDRYPLEEALSAVSHRPNGGGRPCKVIEWDGHQMTKRQWAAHLGVTFHQFNYRYRCYGLSERTFKPPTGTEPSDWIESISFARSGKRGRPPAIIKWDGKAMTVKQWAASLNITVPALHARLRLYGISERTFRCPALNYVI